MIILGIAGALVFVLVVLFANRSGYRRGWEAGATFTHNEWKEGLKRQR